MGSLSRFSFIGGVNLYECTRTGLHVLDHVRFQCFVNVCAGSIAFPIDELWRVYRLILRVLGNLGIYTAASADPSFRFCDFFNMGIFFEDMSVFFLNF